MKTWIVVINRAEARIFETNSKEQGEIKFISKLENPKGRLKAIDINADKPGYTMSSATMHRGRLEKPQGPVERVAAMWAKEVVEHLDAHRIANSFDEITLVVEPHYLGVIRNTMHKELAHLVTREIPKDLGAVTTDEIRRRIAKKQQSEAVEINL
jgi:protein required for attachment to host cells